LKHMCIILTECIIRSKHETNVNESIILASVYKDDCKTKMNSMRFQALMVASMKIKKPFGM